MTKSSDLDLACLSLAGIIGIEGVEERLSVIGVVTQCPSVSAGDQ